jgi:hypothetical protein
VVVEARLPSHRDRLLNTAASSKSPALDLEFVREENVVGGQENLLLFSKRATSVQV